MILWESMFRDLTIPLYGLETHMATNGSWTEVRTKKVGTKIFKDLKK